MADQPSPWQRFKDNFIRAAIHSPLGGGGLARAYYRHNGKTHDQINQAVKSLDDDFDKKYKNAPAIQHVRKGHPLDYASPDNVGRAVTGLLGSLLGGVDPTFALMPGRNAVQRIAGQTAVQGGASAVRQKVRMNTGQQEKFDPTEVLEDALIGTAFQSGGEIVGKAARAAKEAFNPTEHLEGLAPDGMPSGNGGSVRPMDPHEIARIMGDPEAAGGAPLQRRQNNRDYNPKEELYPEDFSLDDTFVQNEQPSVQAQGVVNDMLAPEDTIRRPHPLDDVLTPAEQQEMDASADKPIVDNTGYEAHTPYIEQAPEPANDRTRSEALKRLIPSLLEDERGTLGYQDEAPGVPHEDTPVGRLTKAIDEAAPLRDKQGKLYSQERAKRFSEVAKRQNYVEGEEGLHAQLAAMKGALPKVEFEPIVHNLDPVEVKGLYTQIWRHPRLSASEKLSAGTGFQKLLGEHGGGLPTDSELRHLRTVFGDNLVNTIEKKRSLTGMDVFNNIANIPRALKSTLDLSAPLRQGAPLIHRKEFWTSFATMFKQAGSEKVFQKVQNEIYSRPSYSMMKEAGLSLTRAGKNLTDREEAFMSNWAEKIPVAGKLVRASDRAYVGFLNKLRADTFDSLVKEAKLAGIDFKQDPKALKDIAKYINTSTGRGSLEGLVPGGNASAPFLAGVFFSPRLMASRVNMLNPLYYKNLSPFARKQAIKSFIAYGGIVTTVLGLASMAGAEVETDPRHTDFAKIKIGDVRYDVTGGFNTYLRFAAQMATGQSVNADDEESNLGVGPTIEGGKYKGMHSHDEGFGAKNRATAIATFLANKENPLLNFAVNAVRDGRDDYGNPIPYDKQASDLVAPMIAADTWEVMQDMGPKEAAKTVLPNLFGIGVQNYKAKDKPGKVAPDGFDDFMQDDDTDDTLKDEL